MFVYVSLFATVTGTLGQSDSIAIAFRGARGPFLPRPRPPVSRGRRPRSGTEGGYRASDDRGHAGGGACRVIGRTPILCRMPRHWIMPRKLDAARCERAASSLRATKGPRPSVPTGRYVVHFQPRNVLLFGIVSFVTVLIAPSFSLPVEQSDSSLPIGRSGGSCLA